VSGTQTGKKRRFTVDALFTDTRPQAVGVNDLPIAKEIRLDRIVPDPDQPRKTFDDEKLEELAASIRIEGVLQPIVVRYDEPRDTYIVVHGERRWRASKLAGQATIPALVREIPEERRLIQQLMENVVREDLNAIDRAAALRVLKAQLGDVSWEAVADTVGIRRSRLFQLLSTGKLPDEVQEDLRTGRLSEKQTRVLQGLAPELQSAVRDAMLNEHLTNAEAAKLASALRGCEPPENPAELVAAQIQLLPGRIAPQDELNALLAALEAVAASERTGYQTLRKTARSLSVPPFKTDRFQHELLALARSLSRATPADLTPDSEIGSSLKRLHAAIAALLGE
jgi:ParB family chromosome partitioning protein